MFPATDAGVAIQLIVIAVVAVIGLALARRHPEIRILIIGIWLVTYGAIGVRALH